MNPPLLRRMPLDAGYDHPTFRRIAEEFFEVFGSKAHHFVDIVDIDHPSITRVHHVPVRSLPETAVERLIGEGRPHNIARAMAYMLIEQAKADRANEDRTR